jgi:hypothetical protein
MKLKRVYPNRWLRRDAESVAGGMYKMNARGSFCYGFCPNRNYRVVSYGEFLWKSELKTCFERVSYLLFDNGKYYKIIGDWK